RRPKYRGVASATPKAASSGPITKAPGFAGGYLPMGNTSSVKWLGTIAEYRIDWGPGYRIYLGRDGEILIVLLGGGTEKNQDADIAQARMLWSEYKARKATSRPKGKR